MGESPSSQVFFELEGLISDALQVISYKWLSRKFSISSNIAKRLLERFVTQNPQLDLEIVYAVSGYSKTDPEYYSIQLVPKSRLEGARAALKENPSVHVYSVQRCLPKDPAQLWSADFVQSLELFNEPPDVSNCLRDNRFSAVACDAIQRSLARRSSGSTSSPQASAPDIKPHVGPHTHPARPVSDVRQSSLFPKHAGVDMKPVKHEIPAASPAQVNLPPKEACSDIKPIKNEPPPGSEPNVNAPKPSILSPATGKRKASGSGPPSGGNGGGAISNLWGKAASKPKVPSPPRATEPPPAVMVAGVAEARIQAMEAGVYSDEDVEQHALSRTRKSTGRRRMIVEDDDSGNEEAAEDEEMIVRLATPDSPQDIKPQVCNGQTIPTRIGSKRSEVHPKPTTPELEPPSNILQDKNTMSHNPQPAKSVKKEEEADEKSNSIARESPGSRGGPKRKKVMHTRIDEKGREVTEVVWVTEGEESVANDQTRQLATAKHAAPTNKESDSKTSAERSRPAAKPNAAPSKAPAAKGGKSTGKSGGKHQGSIMSFFKKQ
ncbi:hypothetical protein R1flu_016807 [Riccia fluitans]|uniref:DNA polymerase delta subunit 3 n=1 Tax=Riccia fluitans TaxID=41844 RepID=A0ABD1YNE6_9MARC